MNFKSYSKSHKLKKRIPTTKEQQAVFYNTHEAIIEDAVFERVQELRAHKRRLTKADRQGLFSNKSNMGHCTAYYIREEVLKQIVWGRIFDVTALFFDDITAFREMNASLKQTRK